VVFSVANFGYALPKIEVVPPKADCPPNILVVFAKIEPPDCGAIEDVAAFPKEKVAGGVRVFPPKSDAPGVKDVFEPNILPPVEDAGFTSVGFVKAPKLLEAEIEV
jgi:hypothetical protein